MKHAIISTILSVLSLTACSSDSNTIDEVSPAIGQAVMNNSILNLWILNPGDSPSAYFEITENEITYFFPQDASVVLNSQNCFLIEKEPIEFISENTVIFPNRDESGESTIQASADTLSISYIDSLDDDDDDGDTTESIVEIFPLVEYISATDLNECV